MNLQQGARVVVLGVVGTFALALAACGGKPTPKPPPGERVTLTATRAVVEEIAGAAPDVAAVIQEHLGGVEESLTQGDPAGAATHVVAILPALHDERLPQGAGSQVWVALSDELQIGAGTSKVPTLTVTDHPGMNCDDTTLRCTVPDPAWNCQEVFEGGVHKGCALRKAVVP